MKYMRELLYKGVWEEETKLVHSVSDEVSIDSGPVNRAVMEEACVPLYAHFEESIDTPISEEVLESRVPGIEGKSGEMRQTVWDRVADEPWERITDSNSGDSMDAIREPTYLIEEQIEDYIDEVKE